MNTQNTQPERNQDEMPEVEGYGTGIAITIPPGAVGISGTEIDVPPGAVGQSSTITISPTPASGTVAPLGGGGGSMFNPTPLHHLFSVRH